MDPIKTEIAILGGGCFWCTEAVFKMFKGVLSVDPGYSGGATENPTYEEVSTGDTGHAEVIRIVYDPALVSYHTLLTVFFASHDPTTFNRQGNDIGTQYRSVIFYVNPEQMTEASQFIKNLDHSAIGGAPIMTELSAFKKFYPAEDYHKHYFEHHKDNPYCELVINPKLEKVQKEFAELLKATE